MNWSWNLYLWIAGSRMQTEVSTSHLWGENSLFAALKGFVFREQLNKTSWVLWVLHYVGDTPAASLSVDCATNLLETDWPPKQHRWRGWQYNLVRTLFFENRHLLVSKGPETARRQTSMSVCSVPWNHLFAGNDWIRSAGDSLRGMPNPVPSADCPNNLMGVGATLRQHLWAEIKQKPLFFFNLQEVQPEVPLRQPGQHLNSRLLWGADGEICGSVELSSCLGA